MHVRGSITGEIVLLECWPSVRDAIQNVWLRVAELRLRDPGNIRRVDRVDGHGGWIEVKEHQAAIDATHVKLRVICVPGILFCSRRRRVRLKRSPRVCLGIGYTNQARPEVRIDDDRARRSYCKRRFWAGFNSHVGSSAVIRRTAKFFWAPRLPASQPQLAKA